MRSIDNIVLLAGVNHAVDFTNTSPEKDTELIQKEINENSINKVLKFWTKATNFQGVTFPTYENYEKARLIEDKLKLAYKAHVDANAEQEGSKEIPVNLSSRILQDKTSFCPTMKVGQCFESHKKFKEKQLLDELDSRRPEEKVLRYRVTCNRVGTHSFGSQDAATHFGGELQNRYNWVVDLSFYDAEFILNIREGFLYYGVALTQSSMHRRNIVCFGATTLRATICYNMLRISSPKPGDIVVDPLCGGGSIPIEGSLAFPATYYLGGDIHEKAISLTQGNLENLRQNHSYNNNIDQLSWNATRLPLKDGSVDIFISDLPFGKRSGSVKDNRILYKEVLTELGRVVRAPTGRASLLTHDTGSLNKALASVIGIWWPSKTVKVNIGGLLATVFVLKRSLCIERLLYMKKRAKKNKSGNS